MRAGTILASAALVVGAAVVAWLLAAAVAVPHVTVLLLAPVAYSAVRWGLATALVAALLAVAISAFFFMPPIYSFYVSAPQDLIDLVVFVVVAVVISGLARRVQAQALDAERREADLRHLRVLGRSLAAVLDADRLLMVLVGHWSTVLGGDVALLLPRRDGPQLVVHPDQATRPGPEEFAAARAVLAGAATTGRLSDRWVFRRLATEAGTVGLLAIAGKAEPVLDDAALSPLLRQTAIIVERARPPAA